MLGTSQLMGPVDFQIIIIFYHIMKVNGVHQLFSYTHIL